MASETATTAEAPAQTRFEPWQAGILGGFVGGLVFGALMTMEMRIIVEMAIPGMYGLEPSLGVGWVVHIFHSVVLGVVFAVLVGATGLGDRLDSNLTIAVAGLAYGVVLWIVLASFVMPAWVGTMTEMAPTVPDWNVQSLLGHAVYGVVLGLVYAILARK